jgi:hypothetical protein
MLIFISAGVLTWIAVVTWLEVAHDRNNDGYANEDIWLGD